MTPDVAGPYVAFVAALEARIETLEGWKREAILVLDQWDRVFEAARVHEAARLGESKSAVVLRALDRIAASPTPDRGCSHE